MVILGVTVGLFAFYPPKRSGAMEGSVGLNFVRYDYLTDMGLSQGLGFYDKVVLNFTNSSKSRVLVRPCGNMKVDPYNPIVSPGQGIELRVGNIGLPLTKSSRPILLSMRCDPPPSSFRFIGHIKAMLVKAGLKNMKPVRVVSVELPPFDSAPPFP